MNPLWIVTVRDEPHLQLEWCLNNIYLHNPDAKIVVINDGAIRSDSKFNIHRYIDGEWLKRSCRGAEWWDRFFCEALQHPEWNHVIKIDPDAKVHRPFREIPDADFFGNVSTKGTFDEHIQGHCQGFSRRFAERVVNSGIARHERYRDVENRIIGPGGRAWLSDKPEGFTSIDAMIWKIAAALGFPATDWPEVMHEPTNPNADYAVTHPHKLP